MSRFTVQWLDDAVQDLAQCWMDAEDRDAVRAAADSADSHLAHKPDAAGTHLREGLYRLRIPPLRVYFAIRQDDQLVEVSAVRLL